MRVGSTRYCGALALVCAAALAFNAAPAQASGTLNSQCSPSAKGFGIISNSVAWAQTFPANNSGKLLTVGLKGIARASGGSGGDIAVQLYGTDGTGTPVAPVLASTAIPSASIPADNVIRDYSADFNPSAAAYLTSGHTYGIALSTADTQQNSWNFGEADPCPGGAFFLGIGGPPFGLPEGHTDYDAGLTTYLGPANDDFDHAEVLSGSTASVTGLVFDATRRRTTLNCSATVALIAGQARATRSGTSGRHWAAARRRSTPARPTMTRCSACTREAASGR